MMHIRLDLLTVLKISARLSIPWLLIFTAIAVFANQPGVVCITPMLWALGAVAGRNVSAASHNPSARLRVIEAGIAGALLGLVEGIYFSIALYLFGELTPEESQRMVLFSAIVTLLGIAASGALALFVACLAENRTAEKGSS
jgi:hypothetical protein